MHTERELSTRVLINLGYQKIGTLWIKQFALGSLVWVYDTETRTQSSYYYDEVPLNIQELLRS